MLGVPKSLRSLAEFERDTSDHRVKQRRWRPRTSGIQGVTRQGGVPLRIVPGIEKPVNFRYQGSRPIAHCGQRKVLHHRTGCRPPPEPTKGDVEMKVANLLRHLLCKVVEMATRLPVVGSLARVLRRRLGCDDEARHEFFVNRLFPGPAVPHRGYTLRATASDFQAQSLDGEDLVLVASADGAHEVVHVAGRLVAYGDVDIVRKYLRKTYPGEFVELGGGSPASESDDTIGPEQAGTGDGSVGQEAADSSPGPLAMSTASFRFSAADAADRAKRVLDVLLDFDKETGRGAERRAAVVPLRSFASSQKFKPAYDLDGPTIVPAPTSMEVANPPRIHVLDTGLAAQRAWPTAKMSTWSDADSSDIDPLYQAGLAPLLAWTAGHGTFVASICHQLDPRAEIKVHRVGTEHGLVNEDAVCTRIEDLAAQGVQADILVLPFGGTEAGLPGTTADDTWQKFTRLSTALDAFLAAHPGAVVVAAAGNENVTTKMYPAAFSTTKARVLSVGSTKRSGGKSSFSNSGSWVNASACGENLASMYVFGKEEKTPGTEGDVFEGFAIGTGTSFAAAVVAGVISRSMNPQKNAAAVAANQPQKSGKRVFSLPAGVQLKGALPSNR